MFFIDFIHLEIDVNFISSVGNDELGNKIVDHFKKNNLILNSLILTKIIKLVKLSSKPEIWRT
jgi:sugar/nucleoside kinase (ribokinase family)